MTEEKSSSELMEYFFSILSHLCHHRNLSLKQVMDVINDAFKEDHDAWRMIFNKILLDQKAQKSAEKALADIAESMNIKKQYRTRLWSENPGRDIDWSQTLLHTLTGDKGRFCNIARSVQIDRQLAAGLIGIAQEWQQAVQFYAPTGAKDRIASLEKAIQVLSSNVQSRHPLPWSTLLERKLEQKDPARAQYISHARSLWLRQAIHGENLAKTLKGLWQEKIPRLKNPDNLFEWIITNRIGISAQTTGWIWIEHREGTDFFSHPIESWQLALYKGRLRNKGKRTDKDIDSETEDNTINDAIKNAYKDAGMESNGMMPDIVLEFFKDESPKNSLSYYFIGDAKRNTKDLQKNYIRASISKAAVYLHAFEKHLTINPKCTLFFWQGIDQVLGDPIKEGQCIDFSKAGNRSILCLDLKCIKPEYGNNTSQEDPLNNWLAYLFTQAIQNYQNNVSTCEEFPHVS